MKIYLLLLSDQVPHWESLLSKRQNCHGSEEGDGASGGEGGMAILPGTWLYSQLQLYRFNFRASLSCFDTHANSSSELLGTFNDSGTFFDLIDLN